LAKVTTHTEARSSCCHSDIRRARYEKIADGVAASSCRGRVDESATEPFLLLHREHGMGCRRSWNCCDRRTRFIMIWKHFCLILFTGTRIRI